MQERFEDDDDLATALLGESLQRACDALLEALTQGEHMPANMPDTNVDRFPRLFPSPVHAGLLASPAGLCADRAAPPEEGRRR